MRHSGFLLLFFVSISAALISTALAADLHIDLHIKVVDPHSAVNISHPAQGRDEDTGHDQEAQDHPEQEEAVAGLERIDADPSEDIVHVLALADGRVVATMRAAAGPRRRNGLRVHRRWRAVTPGAAGSN